jgi:outer membrane protein, heavy metal efflux system
MLGLSLAIVLPLGVGGCAGTSKPSEAAFQQWSRADQRWYSGRNADLGPAMPLSSEDPSLPENAGFDDYVHYAMKHNPGLEAAFYRWRAALERVPQARALPDPRLTLGIVLDEVDRNTEYMGERYTISQMFPWFGKLALEGDIALEQAHAEAQQFEAARLQLIDQVSRAYFEYAFQHQAVRIARENLNLLNRLETVSRAMFRAGTASLADVYRAQIEIGRLDDQVRSLQDQLGVATAELNAALGRPANASLPALRESPLNRMVSELPEYSDEEWLALARQHNPELAAARHNAEQQRQGIALARKNYYPDIEVGVEYGRDASARIAMMDGGGADMITGMVSINIPLWRRKYDAGVRETRARFGEAIRQIESRENGLESELKLALYTYRDSLRKLSLYGDTLLPMANQTLATTETAYRGGNAIFSDMIDAQRILLEFSLARERAAADRAQAFTRIQTLVGRAIDDDATLKTTPDGEAETPSPSPLAK